MEAVRAREVAVRREVQEWVQERGKVLTEEEKRLEVVKEVEVGLRKVEGGIAKGTLLFTFFSCRFASRSRSFYFSLGCLHAFF